MSQQAGLDNALAPRIRTCVGDAAGDTKAAKWLDLVCHQGKFGRIRGGGFVAAQE
jgi:hypothetical protein